MDVLCNGGNCVSVELGNHGCVQQELHDHLCCLQKHFPDLGLGRVPVSSSAGFLKWQCSCIHISPAVYSVLFILLVGKIMRCPFSQALGKTGVMARKWSGMKSYHLLHRPFHRKIQCSDIFVGFTTFCDNLSVKHWESLGSFRIRVGSSMLLQSWLRKGVLFMFLLLSSPWLTSN